MSETTRETVQARQEGRLGDHRVLADEPVERGGTNQAPAPLEYFVGAVGF